MKKTFSLLLALALVLSFSVMAVPSGPAMASPGNLYVDDGATADGTVVTCKLAGAVGSNELYAHGTPGPFQGYDAGDAVEFISGTADGWVTTIATKYNSNRVRLASMYSGGDFSDGTFNLVDLDAPSSGDPFRYIQSAIDMASSTTINVAAGTYDETLNIEGRNNISIVGEDKNTTIIKSSTSLGWGNPAGGSYGGTRQTMIRVVGSTDIDFSNFTFDFSLMKTAVSGISYVSGIWYWSSTGTIDNNILKDIGILDDGTIVSVQEHAIYARAMIVGGYSHAARADVAITNNEFINTGRTGVNTHDYVDVTIDNNLFHKDAPYDGSGGFDGGYGIEVGSESTGTVTDNTIYGYETGEGWTSAGIYIENAFTNDVPTPFTKTVSVEGNEVYSSEVGVHLGDPTTFHGVSIVVNFSDNNIHDNRVAGVQITDHDAGDGSSVTVNALGNIITNNGAYGYYIYTKDDGDVTLNASGETITNHDQGVFIEDRVAAASTSAYAITIANSDIFNNTTYGLHNDITTTQITATNNWWGDDSGPSGVGPGTGDAVSANVLYSPWTTGKALTHTGTGIASFTPSAGTITVTAVPTPPGAPVTLPHGMFSFNVTGLASGQTVIITIELPGPVPVGSKWWKYQAGAWYSLPIGDDDGDNVITVTLTDGGQGDADNTANGQIIDDGGPGLLYRGLIIRSTEGGRVTKPGEGNHVYEHGTLVKLVATPDDGYKFVEWTHDVRRIDDVNAAETTITMDWSYVVIANFVTVETSTVETSVQYELNVSSTIGGLVASPGEGTFPYIEGTVVNLVANPDAGYEFVNWTGDGITSVDSTTTSVTMNGDCSVQANFEFEQTTGTDSDGEPSVLAGCFIATAAYGTPTAEQIDVLREFRDVVLLEKSVGSQFVALYYRLSPPVADFIAGNNFLKTVVRELVVDPVVWLVEATGDIWRN